MPYSPPIYDHLKHKVSLLKKELDKELGRYEILQPVKSPLEESNCRLEVLIARCNVLINSESDRKTEKEVFVELVNELSPFIKKGDENSKHQSTMYLLGALIHRYFRLIDSYKKTSGYGVFGISLFGYSDPKEAGCRLFCSIRTALLLKDESKDYKVRDLEKLDALTISTALEVFKTNMYAKDEKKLPKFMTFRHLREDENFEKYLNEMSSKWSLKAEPHLIQYQAIDFIRSLVDALDKKAAGIEAESKKYVSYYRDKVTAPCDIDDISYFAAEPKRTEAENDLLTLSGSKYLTDRLKDAEWSEVVELFTETYSQFASWRLLGAFILVSKQFDESAKLITCINNALGPEESLDSIDREAELLAIRSFRKFIDTYQSAELNCKFFDDKVAMEKLLRDFHTKLEKQNKTSEEMAMSMSMK